jgi:Tol biopolymer transport system component
MTNRQRRVGIAFGMTIAALMSTVMVATAARLGPWTTATNAEAIGGTSDRLNTSSNDGCPIESPDGLRLYMATNRPGGYGGIDIWVASRTTQEAGFGAPVNLGPVVNSSADDFCPTPLPGGRLFFVSSRAVAGTCGGADIYLTRRNPKHGWTAPANLGCQVNGPLSEAGPSYFEADGSAYLYFSSGPDIYVSARQADGSFGTRAPVAELNTTAADLRPNVRKDGLEIVFDSDRTGTVGSADLWFASRASTSEPWSTPINAGAAINTAANETRGSFSGDGLRLYFGRSPGPEGGSDIFVATRQPMTGD